MLIAQPFGARKPASSLSSPSVTTVATDAFLTTGRGSSRVEVKRARTRDGRPPTATRFDVEPPVVGNVQPPSCVYYRRENFGEEHLGRQERRPRADHHWGRARWLHGRALRCPRRPGAARDRGLPVGRPA